LLTVRSKPKKAVITTIPSIQSDTYEQAREYATGWDIRVLEDEWRDWVMQKKINVIDADTHFLKFCKNRGPYRNQLF
jgi:hypothetical protein